MSSSVRVIPLHETKNKAEDEFKKECQKLKIEGYTFEKFEVIYEELFAIWRNDRLKNKTFLITFGESHFFPQTEIEDEEGVVEPEWFPINLGIPVSISIEDTLKNCVETAREHL